MQTHALPDRWSTERRPEVGRARKFLLWILIVFGVYAVFRSPDQAADIVRSAWDGILAGFSAVGDFFDALLTGS